MPRQPYLPTYSRFKYTIGALVVKERPELCAVIGKCISLWSHVDNEMGNLLGILLGTETEAALEVFLTLRKASNQREALNAAAKHKLSGKEKQVFEAILQVYSSLENQRNDLAHGCFGICPDDADILFWIELKHHIHFQVEVLANEANGKFENDRHARLKPHLFAYRKSDLESLYSQMEEFWRIIFYFNGYLRNPSDLDRQAEYHRLQAFQLIKNALKK